MKRLAFLAIMAIFCLIQPPSALGATDLQDQSSPPVTEEEEMSVVHWQAAPPDQLKPYLSTMGYTDEMGPAVYRTDGREVFIVVFLPLPGKQAPTNRLIAAFCYTTSTDADGVEHYYLGELLILVEHDSKGDPFVVYDTGKACP